MFGLRAGCIVAEEPFDLLWIAVPNLLERFAHVGLSKAHGRGFELGQAQMPDWLHFGNLGIACLHFGQAMAPAAHADRMQLSRIGNCGCFE